MVEFPKSAALSLVELDTIASVLPVDRRDELTELLTDQDVETTHAYYSVASLT